MQKLQKVESFKSIPRLDNTPSEYQAQSELSKSFRKEYDKDPYTPYQTILYKRTLMGLKFFSQEEQDNMSPFRKEYIRSTCFKAQQELNIMKQRKIITFTNSLLGMFSKSALAEDMIGLYSKPTRNFWSEASLNDLDISKQDVIDHFCKKRILPDFFKSL